MQTVLRCSLVGVSAAEARRRANPLGGHAEDKAPWSDTGYVRKIQREHSLQTNIRRESGRMKPEGYLEVIDQKGKEVRGAGPRVFPTGFRRAVTPSVAAGSFNHSRR